MTLVINWEMVRQEAFTAIRKDFMIDTLDELSVSGNYTPVSGDSLAPWKTGKLKVTS